MRLRSKVIAISTIAVLASMLVTFTVTYWVVMSSFEGLEVQTLQEHMERAFSAIHDELGNLTATLADWSNWDDSYRFAQDGNSQYIQDNLSPEAISNLQINYIAFYKRDDQLIYAEAVDLLNGAVIPIPDYLKSLQPSAVYPPGDSPAEAISGIQIINGLPAMVVVSPIRQSDRSGEPSGFLVMGKLMNESWTDAFAERLGIGVKLLPPLSEAGSATTLQARDALILTPISPESLPGNPAQFFYQPFQANRLAGFSILYNWDQAPVSMIRLDIPRDITERGRESFTFLVTALLATLVIVASVSLVLIERIVLRRLEALYRDLRHIQKTGDFAYRLHATGRDEITKVAEAGNELLSRVQQTQAEIIHARDEAVSALRLKDQILANVSHDIRTPLTIISLKIDALRSQIYGPFNTKQDQALSQVQLSTKRLFFFFSNLLESAAIKGGRARTRQDAFNPTETITEVVETMRPLTEEKDLELRLEVDPALPEHIVGDSDRINQILFNLIGNAIKFTNQGNVTLRVVQPRPDCLSLVVSDTGIGIPAEQQPHLFKEFWQLDGSSTRKFSGVGLGLAIVKQITSLLDGEITVQSEPGKGTSFTVTLPIQPQEAPDSTLVPVA